MEGFLNANDMKNLIMERKGKSRGCANQIYYKWKKEGRFIEEPEGSNNWVIDTESFENLLLTISGRVRREFKPVSEDDMVADPHNIMSAFTDFQRNILINSAKKNNTTIYRIITKIVKEKLDDVIANITLNLD
jgi:hypothetical protein